MVEISLKEHIEATISASVIVMAAFFGAYAGTSPDLSDNGLNPGDAFAFKGTIILSAVTFILAIGTFLVWRATVQMAKNAEETSKIQLRAYVYLPDVDFRYDGPRSQVKYVVKNFGHTPAHKVTIQSLASVVKLSIPIESVPQFESTTPTNTGSLAPNGDFINDNFDIPFATIVRDDEAVCFAGRITYRDIYDSARFTNFRYSISGRELNRLYKENDSKPVTAEMYAENEGNDST